MKLLHRGNSLWTLTLFLGGAVLTLSLLPQIVRASGDDRGALHVTKECSEYASGYCVIVTSNIPEITAGFRVYYDQPQLNAAGMLDSNVLLIDPNHTGNWAVGRCTLGAAGLCTFSDGRGTLAGFHARVDVSHLGGVTYGWDGTYAFSGENREGD